MGWCCPKATHNCDVVNRNPSSRVTPSYALFRAPSNSAGITCVYESALKHGGIPGGILPQALNRANSSTGNKQTHDTRFLFLDGAYCAVTHSDPPALFQSPRSVRAIPQRNCHCFCFFSRRKLVQKRHTPKPAAMSANSLLVAKPSNTSRRVFAPVSSWSTQ